MVQDQIWPHWLCQLWAERDDERRGKKKKGKILLLLHQNILFSSRYLITTASAVSGRRTEILKGIVEVVKKDNATNNFSLTTLLKKTLPNKI
jgi:hypothetical protein